MLFGIEKNFIQDKLVNNKKIELILKFDQIFIILVNDFQTDDNQFLDLMNFNFKNFFEHFYWFVWKELNLAFIQELKK